MKFLDHHHVGSVFLITGFFLLLITITIVSPISTTSTNAFGVSDIIEKSNQARAQLGSDPLTTDNKLMSAAQMKAEDMAKGHYFAHTAPDGTVPWDYFKKVGYVYDEAGENLAVTNQDAANVIDGWLNSPTHRENLLSKKYTNMGIGMAVFGEYEGHKDTYVIVAMYGKRGAGSQLVTAATSPAGTTTSFKPALGVISPTLAFIFATALIMLGLVLELRHIKRIHHAPQIH